MRRGAARGAARLGATLVAAAALLSGCVALGAPTGAPAAAGASAPPPLEPEVGHTAPPPNDLDDLRITELIARCPDVLSDAALRTLPQHGVDAVSFFATTGQCADVGAVLAVDSPRPFVSPLQYIDAPCPGGTLLTVWAHYDDDLIFGSPTIPRALDAGRCVRTLYLTASDAGLGEQYELAREAGLRAAYDAMRGAATPWEDRTVLLSNGITLAMTRPSGDPRISLFFLRLPDSGLDGNGFQATGHSGIPKLLGGLVAEAPRFGGAAPLKAVDLPATVSQLYDAYAPDEVLTALPAMAQGSRGDHPDHAATGGIVADLADRGLIDPRRVTYAQGYPISGLAPNLHGDELARKLDAFAKYAAHDAVLRCSTVDRCLKLPRTGPWLVRQYLIPHDAIVRAGA
ncbi:MAG: hypothetical protein GX871_04260 [Microbacteriaceae bacterium]|jgi:LmbE family N-acetylglucosaminyl deacetylase|nr:hypothetical protein [Microbacteriaceae bacterium]HOA87418.1 PIG-L family deacetylase [Microbacteriaceae bacterium]HPZ34499.1 PIG-L family deacetylase [Microbacteriaceae bacterium]HQC93348.1 PIG-L family deacetylase [Microbacteriaceae bacterium]